MAVGINAVRAICARTPSVLSTEDEKQEREDAGASSSMVTASVAFDIEAFVRDIAAYGNHRDRSVSIAGKSFTNFIRVTHPSLLQGKNRGLKGSALHRAKEKPMRYGEHKVNYGVEGADLLLEYEAKKAAYEREQERREAEGGGSGDEEEEQEEDMNDVEEEEDEEAPDLVVVDPKEKKGENDGSDDGVLDLSKMTQEERNKLKQEVSSTRVFTASDFAKMRKLVEREERARRDPREAARRKRAIARGQEFDELSEDGWSSNDDDDDGVRIKGAVNPDSIMAEARRKRKSKAEKLQKVLEGRQKFESNDRAGGSTNTEKERKKNFLMSKSSKRARSKGRGKGGLAEKRGRGGMGKTQMYQEAKKRRRKT